jgi:hypothetical protein
MSKQRKPELVFATGIPTNHKTMNLIKKSYNMNRDKFKELTPEQQWKWVIENKDKITLIELDNDCTYICAECFKEAGNSECTGSISMESYLGNGWGINHLISALGIECRGV